MAATVSLILKVLAVASTGLITLSEVAVSDIPVPIELQYEFVDRKSRLGAWGELVYATLGGVANQGLSFPQGTPSDFAFQSFKAEAPPGTEVRGRVDALGASLACESASLDIKGSKGPLGDFRLGNLKNVTMRSKTCNMTSYLVSERNITFARNFSRESDGLGIYFSRFTTGSCQGQKGPDANRMGFMLGHLAPENTSILPANCSTVLGDEIRYPHSSPYFWNCWDVLPNVTAIMRRSTQIICKPLYGVSSATLVSKGDTNTPRVELDSASEPRLFPNIHPWDLVQAHAASYSYLTGYVPVCLDFGVPRVIAHLLADARSQ